MQNKTVIKGKVEKLNKHKEIQKGFNEKLKGSGHSCPVKTRTDSIGC